jgi:hypothetical protein
MSLEERLFQLERRSRYLTIALAAAVLVPVVMLLAGAGQFVSQTTSLRASQLDVIDNNGLLRVRIGQVNDEFGIFVYDPRGQARAALTDAPDAAGLVINKEGGNVRLLANRQGTDITLRDGRDVVRAVATGTVAGGSLVIHSGDGQVFTVPPADN